MCCEKCCNGQRDTMGSVTMEGTFPSCVEKVIGVTNQQLRTEFNLH